MYVSMMCVFCASCARVNHLPCSMRMRMRPGWSDRQMLHVWISRRNTDCFLPSLNRRRARKSASTLPSPEMARGSGSAGSSGGGVCGGGGCRGKVDSMSRNGREFRAKNSTHEKMTTCSELVRARESNSRHKRDSCRTLSQRQERVKWGGDLEG